MAGEPHENLREPLATLLAVFEEPERAPRRLPRLLSLLDEDDDSVRIGACWAICRVLVESPDMTAYLVRRLADRLERDPTPETELLFSYLWAKHPDTTEAELAARADEKSNRPRIPSFDGSLARSDYLQPGLGDRPIGRTRIAGRGSSAGPGRVFTDDDDHREEDELARAVDDDSDGSTPEAESDPGDEAEADSGVPASEGSESDAGHDLLGPRAESGQREPSELLEAITNRSVFDQLSVLAGRHRDRYADVYRTLGIRDGDDVAVGLTLFHRPAERGDRFSRELHQFLERWRSVDEHDNVVTLYEFDTEPRPWAAKEYTDLTLAERGRLPPKLATWNAVQLADALARTHENGVVHAGIDPGNVAYYGNVLDDSERQPPLLTNVGLMHVVRRYFDPTSRLDPRYAAPEYFDRRYGQIDHATDIYQFGAVCYRLFTGVPPYDGDYEAVRTAVVAEEQPRPSDVADVPQAVDDVVTKAMATQKLHRYESVTHMAAEIRAIGDDGDDNGG